MTTSSAQREFAVEIVRQLRAAGYEALLAGGCVRDLLLGRQPKDYDVATTARPEQVRSLFGFRRTLTVGASFGVIVVLPPRGSAAGQVEVATFRSEGPYLDGRRPESVAFCSPEEDAKRRDFTINGMFYDPIEARVLDFVGGEVDLGARVIRAIGDPYERIREDKLRMLRAVRFTATLDFSLDEVTAAAIREVAHEITIVSHERILQELKRMLVDTHRRRAVELCDDLQLLKEILPELKQEADRNWWEKTLAMLSLLQAPSFELAFAGLLHSLPARPVVYDICRRLRLSNDETDHVQWLVAHQDDLADAPSQSQARLKRTLAHPLRDDLLRLLRVKLLAAGEDLCSVMFVDEYLSRTPQSEIDPPTLISGDDLKALGLQPGPSFKRMLDSIRDAQLNGEITLREQAMELARQTQSDEAG